MRSRQVGDKPTLSELRARYEQLLEQFPLPDGISFADVDAGGVPGIWARPANDLGRATVLYLHGGGWVTGTAQGYRGLGARIALAADAQVLILDYALAPERQYPTQLDQTVAAYQWLLGQGIDPGTIVLAGDSAGGGLAIGAALRLRDEAAPMPGAIVGISAVLDLDCTGESMLTNAVSDPLVQKDGVIALVRLYLGEWDASKPRPSPLDADLRGLPPTLLQVSNAEALLDDAVRFAARADQAGATVVIDRYDAVPHVWHIFASFMPEAAEAISRAGKFILTLTGRPEE